MFPRRSAACAARPDSSGRADSRLAEQDWDASMDSLDRKRIYGDVRLIVLDSSWYIVYKLPTRC